MTTVVACPACQQNLQVPPEQLGQPVRCPGCEHVFTAADTAVRAAAAPPPRPPPLPLAAAEKVPAWEQPNEELARPLDEEELAKIDPEAAERLRRKKQEKKARKGATTKGGYYDELTRRQRKMQHENRGVLILILGILSVLGSPCCLLALGACACGYYAYQMGSHDLQQIYSGRANRSGETLIKVGRILGMVGIGISIPAILISLGFMVLALVRAIAA